MNVLASILRTLPPDALNPSGHPLVAQPTVGHLRGGHHHVELRAVMARAARQPRVRRGAAEGNTTSGRLLDEARYGLQKLDLSRRPSSLVAGKDNACEILPRLALFLRREFVPGGFARLLDCPATAEIASFKSVQADHVGRELSHIGD